MRSTQSTPLAALLLLNKHIFVARCQTQWNLGVIGLQKATVQPSQNIRSINNESCLPFNQMPSWFTHHSLIHPSLVFRPFIHQVASGSWIPLMATPVIPRPAPVALAPTRAARWAPLGQAPWVVPLVPGQGVLDPNSQTWRTAAPRDEGVSVVGKSSPKSCCGESRGFSCIRFNGQ